MSVLFGLILSLFLSCERDITDEAEVAGFSTNGDVFIDGFTGGLDYFPFAGSYLEAFTVDTETKYAGSASMRFNVPNVGDPLGAFAGAIFRLEPGRDLTGYDALTFWAKGTRSGRINEIGFGQDFEENKYLVTTDLQLTTYWRKYIIPLPDASKLTQERGMFWYAEGPENGEGYSFWIDELQYERLGTLGQPRPSIFGGSDINADSFIGVTTPITGLRQTFNLGSGIDQTVNVAPSYFEFISSNTSVATVNEAGIITIVGAGAAVITANLNGVEAAGSFTVNSLGEFELAPIPTRDPNNVTSIFSDTYNNVPVDFFNGFWEPFQTTLSADFVVNGNNILNYTNFNFVGNQFSNPTVDATVKSNLHINMYIPGNIPPNLSFLITLVDFGLDQVDGGGDDSRQQVFFNASNFVANEWATLEIPITLATRNNMGLIIYENINGSPLSNFYLDNIYFYN